MGDAARRAGHGHRHPAAEERADLGRLGLHVQGLEIMRNGNEVDLRGKLVGRVAPVRVRERTELARFDEGFELGLYLLERGLLGLRLERRYDVHVIEGVQMVEPEDVGVDELRAFDDVPDDAAVVRGSHLEGVVHAHGRGMAVGGGADAADPLRDVPGVARVPSLQDDLKSAEQRAGRPGILDLAAFDLDIDPQMSFDPCHRVYRDPGHYFLPPSLSLVLPEPAVASAWTATPAAVATAATVPMVSAPASTPPSPGILTPGSFS